MSKIGDTKKRILDRLERKNQTLTEICNILNLAPSTVSQHLKEMVDAGKIRQVDQGQRKWKYYEIRGRTIPANKRRNDFQAKSFFIPIGVLIIIALAGFVFYTANSSTTVSAQQIYLSPGSTAQNGSTVFSISDAPQSYNISALYITITNLSVRGTSGKWYNIPLQKQKFDLVSLDNISAILSSVKLSQGSYTGLVLDTTNVTAVINGSDKTVILPSNKIYILEPFTISNSSTTNWVNIDFNLSSSIHVLDNGSLIMMPVISLRQSIGKDIELGSNDIISPSTPPKFIGEGRFGMDYNGTMKGNFTPPNDIDVGIRGNHVVGIVNGNTTVAFRMPHGIMIGRGQVNAVGDGRWSPKNNWGMDGTQNNSTVSNALPCQVQGRLIGNGTGNLTNLGNYIRTGPGIGCHGMGDIAPISKEGNHANSTANRTWDNDSSMNNWTINSTGKFNASVQGWNGIGTRSKFNANAHGWNGINASSNFNASIHGWDGINVSSNFNASVHGWNGINISASSNTIGKLDSRRHS